MMYPIKEAIKDFTALGGISLYLLLTILFLASGASIMAGRLIIALVLIYAIVIIIRLLYFKERPKKRKYKNIIEKVDSSSFPSMHSARASALAIMLGAETSLAVFIILLLTALGIGIARILMKRHDWIDVSIGYILGLIIGYVAMAIISPLPGMCEFLNPGTCFHFN
jgi:membrane-associated phospholipid phosphatase